MNLARMRLTKLHRTIVAAVLAVVGVLTITTQAATTISISAPE